jgi:hypothetical protein
MIAIRISKLKSQKDERLRMAQANMSPYGPGERGPKNRMLQTWILVRPALRRRWAAEPPEMSKLEAQDFQSRDSKVV